MKKALISLTLSCLLLAGCASLPGKNTGPDHSAETTAGYYYPGSYTEQASAGAIRAFPLKMERFSGFLPMGDHMLVFSGLEECTELILLTGDTLTELCRATLDTVLAPENATLSVTSQGLHFYNGFEFILLDDSLQEVSRIVPPEDLTGTPYLSQDQTMLYYCTPGSVQVLDLHTGISKMLKEISYPVQSISGLLLEDKVIRLSVTDSLGQWNTLYLHADTGSLLYEDPLAMQIATSGSRYYTKLYQNSFVIPVFGETDQLPRMLLLPDTETECSFLPAAQGAVLSSFPEPGSVKLQYIDLDSGRCTASLVLHQALYPWSFHSTGDGFLWFIAYDPQFNCETLYCWDQSLSPSDDQTIHTQTHYTLENPDYSGLAECRQYADSLSARFGIDVLIYRDAVSTQPEDYDLVLEYQVPMIRRELETIEGCLMHYPSTLINKLKEHFPEIHICIVSQLNGSTDAGSLDTAGGIQFFTDSYEAYIALAAGLNTEYTLYHEMCHLIDTVVLNRTSIYDRWDTLNPKEFTYDYDYVANQGRSDSSYLQQENRYFIDLYSMSFPKEDRARIMEYAMTKGNEALFQSTHMQAKLLALCTAIRDAFDLDGSGEVFLWEQYLNQSLASNP